MRLSLIRPILLEDYKKSQPISLQKHFDRLKRLPLTQNNFGYSFSRASVYSTLIEGNSIDWDTWLKYTHSGVNPKSRSYKEIEDLRESYFHAQKNKLNTKTFLKAHAIATRTLLENEQYRGKVRNQDVYIFGDGRKIYTGASKEIAKAEFNKFFKDIRLLLERKLSISECFYFASMIHLVLVKIHPFADGNGRAARLLEKWFLAEKLGANAWFIESEKLYQKRIKSYYRNLSIGTEYSKVDYSHGLQFLLLLPMALTSK